MRRRLVLAGLAGAGLTASLELSPSFAQSSPGVVMAAFGGGNGDTWREMIGKPFTASTSIPVQITDVPNTEVPIRSTAGKPQYNVAWVGYFQAVGLYKDGLLETFDINDFPELKNVPGKFLLKAPDGKLIGIPVQFQYYGIAFNTDQAKASDFPSWLTLGDPKWKGKLAEGQAYVAASYDLVMYAHIADGSEKNIEPGIPAFTAFNKNALTIMTSFAQGNTLLSRGEIAATPFYSGRVAALKKENAPVDITIPKEGAIMLPYMLIVPKGAKNRDAYMAFLKYATQPECQLRMFDYSAYIPLNRGAKLSDAQTKALSMPLSALFDKLYQPDMWLLSDHIRANTAVVEKIQAER